MKTIRIAFDVDGTLRCNCTDTCRDRNDEIVDLMNILSRFKNIELYVWSGGGADYANMFRTLYELPVKESHCLSKGDMNAPEMDIAVDDIQEFSLAKFNLIVRQK